MSYHTFELKYQLSYQEREHLIEALRHKGKVYVDDYDYRHPTVCEALRKYGITIEFTQFIKNDFIFHMMYLIINPRRVMDENNYIGIFDADDTDKMLDRLDNHLQKLTPLMPYVDSFKLNRIDFCTNIRMRSQDEVMSYIRILQKGRIPKKFSIDTYYDLTSKREKLYTNSITFSRNSMSVTFYNKYSQLQENKHCKNIEDAKNILRAEIQCKKNMVDYLSKKFHHRTVRDFLRNSYEIGEYVFKFHIPKFFGGGDFYKLDTVINKIRNSNLKQASKEKMIAFAEQSANHKGLQNAIISNSLKPDKYKSLMKKFNKIGISPIIIPRRYKYDSFENPLSLVLEWYGNTE